MNRAASGHYLSFKLGWISVILYLAYCALTEWLRIPGDDPNKLEFKARIIQGEYSGGIIEE